MKQSFDIYFAKADETITIDFAALPDNAKEYIIAYGLTQQADAASGVATTTGPVGHKVPMEGKELAKAQAEARKKIHERLNALRDGNVPSGGGGGAPLSSMTRAVRQVVKGLLVANGMKAGDADKAVTANPQVAFRDLCAAKWTAKNSMPCTTEKANELFTVNWSKLVEAKARPIAAAMDAAKRATDEIEL